MRNIKLTIILCIAACSAYAQTDKTSKHAAPMDSVRFNAYKTFIGRILATNNTGLVPSVSVSTTTTTPSANVNLPIWPFQYSFSSMPKALSKYQQTADAKSRVFVSVTGNLAANNAFTGTAKGGAWQPDFQVGANVTILLNRIVKFYKYQVTQFPSPSLFQKVWFNKLNYIGPLSHATIAQASQINFSWLNFQGGYKQSSYQLYSTDSPHTALHPQYGDTLKGFYMQTNFNWYFMPANNAIWSWLAMYAQIGVNFTQHATNTDTLSQTSETITTYKLTDTTAITSQKTYSGYGAKKFLTGYAFSIPHQYLLLLNPADNFFVGLGYVGCFNIPQYSAFKLHPSYDAGLLVSFPVNTGQGNNSKSVTNFGMTFTWKDVTQANNMNGEPARQYHKDNFVFNFTASVPLLFGAKAAPPVSSNQ